jgi:carbon-monoxide dehydrogenase small subunit
MDIEVMINGRDETLEAKRADKLLDALRRNGYTGVKRGCDTGDCGFCTVIVDGEARESCTIPVHDVEGSEIETIEGLGTQDDLHPVQEAYVDHHALQCGFCTPGMVMASTAYLRNTDEVTEEGAREAIDDVLCRCTGFEKPVEAILDAAERMEGTADVAADGGTTRDRDDASGGDRDE